MQFQHGNLLGGFSMQHSERPPPEENLFHGLTPKEFVAELDKQVNLKQIILNSNDPLYEKKKREADLAKAQKLAAMEAAAQ